MFALRYNFLKYYQLKPGMENIIKISAEEFDTGTYIYGVETEGHIIKSKKMMIIK